DLGLAGISPGRRQRPHVPGMDDRFLGLGPGRGRQCVGHRGPHGRDRRHPAHAAEQPLGGAAGQRVG
ncbi:MAG: Glutamate Aspartate transport system permease protein GltJ, partial [uncultured Ramlibacter sp.]